MSVTGNTIHSADASPIGWGWILAYGILLFIGAIVVIANPVLAGITTGLLLGLVLCFYGVAALFSGFGSLSGRGKWIEIILGVLAIIAGIMTLTSPVSGALSLVWVIGLWLLVSGVMEVILGFSAKVDRGWRLFLGVLDVVVGLILLFADPAAALTYLAIMLAVRFFFRGVFMTMLAFAVRKLGKLA